MKPFDENTTSSRDDWDGSTGHPPNFRCPNPVSIVNHRKTESLPLSGMFAISGWAAALGLTRRRGSGSAEATIRSYGRHLGKCALAIDSRYVSSSGIFENGLRTSVLRSTLSCALCLAVRSYVARPHFLSEQFVRGYLGDSFGLLPFAHGKPLANQFHRPRLVGFVGKEVSHGSWLSRGIVSGDGIFAPAAIAALCAAPTAGQ